MADLAARLVHSEAAADGLIPFGLVTDAGEAAIGEGEQACVLEAQARAGQVPAASTMLVAAASRPGRLTGCGWPVPGPENSGSPGPGRRPDFSPDRRRWASSTAPWSRPARTTLPSRVITCVQPS